ncbi:MAG TPA: MerR family transcriptional regulator [Ktedonobacteraceae bacterium]|jgi:DNA-binding transcriptional MerR regulator|nr:MerR family transcriptional regulator [Ktedonobacteraceae bacterium]
MFKISEFSQLSQVSVKTLRYYDQLGLLKPAHADPCTGYRSYKAEQLLRLNRILAYKELGFTLQQITQLLDEQIPPEQIRGMFRLKQAQVQELIESEQARMARIEGRLRQIECEGGTIPQHDVVLKPVESQMVVSIRKKTAPTYIPLLLEELDQYLKHHNASSTTTTLPPLVLWHGCEECEEATDLEVAYPIMQRIPESEEIRVHTLPAVQTMASILHQCLPQSVCSASLALADWIEMNSYLMLPDQPRREVYLTREDDGLSVAEVQIPVKQGSEGNRQ